jgi:hypothetical protein
MKIFKRKNRKEKVIMAVNKMLESEHNGQLTLSDLDRALEQFRVFENGGKYLIMNSQQAQAVRKIMESFNHE